MSYVGMLKYCGKDRNELGLIVVVPEYRLTG